MEWIELILLAICVALVVVAGLVSLVIITSEPIPKILCLAGEDSFFDPEAPEQRTRFTTIREPASRSLSVVIPAYNEESRLPLMLDDCLAYLKSKAAKDKDFTYEVILVDDGSADATAEIGRAATLELGADTFRVLQLARNRGKGGAVRMGMLRARGATLLFADADGATAFADHAKLAEALEGVTDDRGHGIACGSRAHLEEDSIAQRSFFRTVLMKGFHACVSFFGAKSVRDTQCGFKLLTRETARRAFTSLHIERWAFDVEVLKIAEMLRVPVAEVAVRWTEIEGSKLNPASAAVQMFKDLLLLWLRYRIGAWRLTQLKKDD